MTKQTEHEKLVEHARKLDSEARKWTERQLRSTYSGEHLQSKPRAGDRAGSRRRESPSSTKKK